MGSDNEAFMPPEMIRRVIESAPPNVVLVGGQALAYWMAYYGIELGAWQTTGVSRDVDFFTTSAADTAPLSAFAKAIGGVARIQPIQALTALVGSATAPADGERIYNVDLIHAVFGLKRENVANNALHVNLGEGRAVRVMHPLDVLRSRNANVHSLPEKRGEAAQQQLRIAIEVARAYLQAGMDAIDAQATLPDVERERRLLRLVQPVVDASGEDAARKNAERHGIHLADAIPAWSIRSAAFWDKQWPHLRARMSPAYADQCERRRAKG